MRFKTTIFLTFLLLVTQAICSPLSNKINRIIKPLEPKARIGIDIRSLKSGKIIYQYHANQYFTPASLTKLLPAIASLLDMHATYRYNTWLLTNATTIDHQTLNGNLFFQLNGDPSLKITDILQMIKKITSANIHRINGHVYIDGYHFNHIPYPPGHLWDDFGHGYGAPIPSIIINRNQWTLNINSSGPLGTRAKLATSIPPLLANIHNDTIITPTWEKKCPLQLYALGKNNYEVKGCIARTGNRMQRQMALADPEGYLQYKIKQALKRAHIQYKGAILFEHTPSNALYLTIHQSKPLKVLLAHMLKDSDNIYADSLIKKFATEISPNGGDWQKGVKRMESIIHDATHIDLSKQLITDGSGLSRYNQITPNTVNRLLQRITQLSHTKEFKNLLARPGETGTLRFRKKLIGMPIYAKTGSMTGVIGLAGYYSSQYSFTILMNNFVGKSKTYKKIENRICQAMQQTA